MAHPEHPGLPYELLQKLVATAGGAVTIVTFFIAFQYIFKLDFVCPCDPAKNWWYCGLYMVLPFCIMAFILLLRDSKWMRICGYYKCKSMECDCKVCKRCNEKCGRFCCLCNCLFCAGCRCASCNKLKCNCYIPYRRAFHCLSLCKSMFMALSAGFMWIIMAFIDGDWFVCLLATNVTVDGRQIACVEKSKQTAEQQVTINYYLNLSRAIGLSCIPVIAFLWTVIRCLTVRCCKPYYKSLYEDYLEEQTEAALKEALCELAKSEVQKDCKEKIQKKSWEEISDPAFYRPLLSPSNSATSTRTLSPTEPPNPGFPSSSGGLALRGASLDETTPLIETHC